MLTKIVKLQLNRLQLFWSGDVVHKRLVLFHDKLLLLRRMEMLIVALQALQASKLI